MNSRSVTVIIPTFNRANLIREAVDSVLRQDITDCRIEIIVVDDGSTDDTPDVLNTYGNKIKYLRLKNGGAGRARNTGIEAAQGEWISFLDSDDCWLPFKLSLQFKVLESFPEIRVVHSDFYSFQGNEIIIDKGLEYWVKSLRGITKVDWSEAYSLAYDSSAFNIDHNGSPFKIYKGNIFAPMLHVCYASCITTLAHRSCFTNKIRFAEDFPTWEDYWFFCRLAEENEILFMDLPTAANRAHDGPRLTTVNDYIAPLCCHLKIIENIYMVSRSPVTPPESLVQMQYRKIQASLMREYLKGGLLEKARELRRQLGESRNGGEFIRNFYYFSSYLPFNFINRLVRVKRLLEQFT